jgi:uncharacterized protein
MIDFATFGDLNEIQLGSFADKPTTTTPGQQEAARQLWQSADGLCSIGIWECTPGHFTADRTKSAEYCQILSGRATITTADGTGARDIGAGDLLVLPLGWQGAWTIHSHMRKVYFLTATAASAAT